MPLLAAVTAFAVAVTSSSIHSASAETVPSPRFSAVDLVDAIAFGQGPAVHCLHPSRQEPFPLDDKLSKVKELVAQSITQNGQLAADLAAKPQSGDRVAVTTAVATLARFAQAAMHQVYGADGISVLNDVDTTARLAYEQFIDQIAGNLRAA